MDQVDSLGFTLIRVLNLTSEWLEHNFRFRIIWFVWVILLFVFVTFDVRILEWRSM